MKKKSQTKAIISILFLLVISFSPCPVFTQDSVKLSEDDLNKNVHYLLKEYGKILHKKNWKVIKEDNQLRAYYYSANYHEVKVRIITESNKDFIKFIVSLYADGENKSREFKTTRKNLPIDSIKAKNTILSFMLSSITSKGKFQINKKVFFSSISIGHNRTHDNRRFYPQWKQGSIYFAGELVYDPSINSKEKEIPLSIGDYLSFVMYAAYDSEIRENYSNIDILLWGKQKYKASNSSETRLLYGFFNGMEYFRPGFSDTTVRWDHQIYKKQPHIQFYIYRALSWGYIHSVKKSGIYTTSFMVGFGPSINSSLNAAGITFQEETLSHIFKSYPKYRRQNYYYSITLPVSISFQADKIHNFKFKAGYNFYIFDAIETGKVFEMLNIFKLSAGYYILNNLMFDINYEFWDISSRLKNDNEHHYWNRLVIELKYLL